jgi:hypothetical protein
MAKKIDPPRHPRCTCGREVVPRWVGVRFDEENGCIVARNRDGREMECRNERRCDECSYARKGEKV